MNVKIMNTQQVKDHIMKKFRRFVKLDERILSKITEILFYSILYVLFSIYVGILINSIFPNFDDKKNDLAILIEVLLQSQDKKIIRTDYKNYKKFNRDVMSINGYEYEKDMATFIKNELNIDNM